MNMLNLKNNLLKILTDAKAALYPAIAESTRLNESALSASDWIAQAYKCMESATTEIQARANENL